MMKLDLKTYKEKTFMDRMILLMRAKFLFSLCQALIPPFKTETLVKPKSSEKELANIDAVSPS